MKRFFVCFVLLGILGGCASMNVTREVVPENTFVSTRWPNIKIKIIPDLKYLGSSNENPNLRNSENIGGVHAQYEHFVFAKGDIALDKFFVVTIARLPKGYYWKELFFDDELNIQKHTTKIDEDVYQGTTRVSGDGIFEPGVSRIFLDNGIFIENTYLTKQISKKFKNREIKVYISYGIALEGSNSVVNNWTGGSGFNKEQQKILSDLEEGFLRDIVIINEKE